jgi:hypothetical protein
MDVCKTNETPRKQCRQLIMGIRYVFSPGDSNGDEKSKSRLGRNTGNNQINETEI